MTCISRRDFLLTSTVAAVSVVGESLPASGSTPLRAPARRAGDKRDWSQVHGFNYQPSYGVNGLELWKKFDPQAIEIELARGKKYFPRMNALRWWQSWDAYVYEPAPYVRNFATTLALAEKYDCLVIPVLFNRWHNPTIDYGGIYIDHFMPGSHVAQPGMFDAYLEAIVAPHRDDPRILAWDLCNEPYWYAQEYMPVGYAPRLASGAATMPRQVIDAESAWLQRIHEVCKTFRGSVPMTVGTHPWMPLEQVDSVSDVLSIHPYWLHHSGDTVAFEEHLDAQVSYARKVGKPLVASECCWGDLDDLARAESIKYTLTQLSRRGIGYLPHVLHHSLVADAHRPEFGPVGRPGNMSFIESDGTLRRGHGIFNDFQ